MSTPVRDEWVAMAALGGKGRYGHAQVTLKDGRVLVAGGTDGTSDLSSCEVFDPARNAWTPVASMTIPRCNIDACVLADGRVFAAGGMSGGVIVNSCEFFDPSINLWAPAPPMPTARHGAGCCVLNDGQVLVAGGDGGSSLRTAEIFNVVRRSWSPAPEMPVPRRFFNALTLADGRVLAAGGYSSGGRVDVFNPQTHAWELVLTHSSLAATTASTILPSGRILCAGFSGTSTLVLDLEAHSAEREEKTGANHALHCTASTLLDNSVLVVGGSNGKNAVERVTLSRHAVGDAHIPRMRGVLFDAAVEPAVAADIHRRVTHARFPTPLELLEPAPTTRFHLRAADSLHYSRPLPSAARAPWMNVALFASEVDVLGLDSEDARRARVSALEHGSGGPEDHAAWVHVWMMTGMLSMGPRVPSFLLHHAARLRGDAGVAKRPSPLGDDCTILLGGLRRLEVRAVPLLVAWIHDATDHTIHSWLTEDAESSATSEAPSLAVGALLLADRVDVPTFSASVWRWIEASTERPLVMWGVLTTSLDTGFDAVRPLACRALAGHLAALDPRRVGRLPWRVVIEVLQRTHELVRSFVTNKVLTDIVRTAVHAIAEENPGFRGREARHVVTEADDPVLGVWCLMALFQTWEADEAHDPDVSRLVPADAPPTRPAVRITLPIDDAIDIASICLRFGLRSSARVCERTITDNFVFILHEQLETLVGTDAAHSKDEHATGPSWGAVADAVAAAESAALADAAAAASGGGVRGLGGSFRSHASRGGASASHLPVTMAASSPSSGERGAAMAPPPLVAVPSASSSSSSSSSSSASFSFADRGPNFSAGLSLDTVNVGDEDRSYSLSSIALSIPVPLYSSHRVERLVHDLPLVAAERILADDFLRTGANEDSAFEFAVAWVEANWPGGSLPCPLWRFVRFPWMSALRRAGIAASSVAVTIPEPIRRFVLPMRDLSELDAVRHAVETHDASVAASCLRPRTKRDGW